MEPKEKRLVHLITLPKKILALHGHENVTEFLFHDLCTHCFNVEKAAYLIDNPDFDCLKGIAGFTRAESFDENKDIWKDPESFSTHMKVAQFNQLVRKLSKESLRKRGESQDAIVQEVAYDLGMKNASFYAWDMKHDNHGLFIYEPSVSHETLLDDDLKNGLVLLSFCPVF